MRGEFPDYGRPIAYYGPPPFRDEMSALEVQMADHDVDRPDDSPANRHDRDSVSEESSALGQRIKGGAKDIAGDIANDDELEDKGERENAAGRERQKRNDAV
jgi:uncharacterized protein YjbJ (UPF0337 family)